MDSTLAIQREGNRTTFLEHCPEAIYRADFVVIRSLVFAVVTCLGLAMLIGASMGLMMVCVPPVFIFLGMYISGIYSFPIYRWQGVLTVLDNTILAPGDVVHRFPFPKHMHTIPLEDEIPMSFWVSDPNFDSRVFAENDEVLFVEARVAYRINPNFISSPTLNNWAFSDFRNGLLQNKFHAVLKQAVWSAVNRTWAYHSMWLSPDAPLSEQVENHTTHRLNSHGFGNENMPVSITLSSFSAQVGARPAST